MLALFLLLALLLVLVGHAFRLPQRGRASAAAACTPSTAQNDS